MWIDVKERLPDISRCGEEFLCVVKECTYFQKYEVAEWFNPLGEHEEAIYENEKPHFLIETASAGQHQLTRDVTHWMELPELPTLK